MLFFNTLLQINNRRKETMKHSFNKPQTEKLKKRKSLKKMYKLLLKESQQDRNAALSCEDEHKAGKVEHAALRDQGDTDVPVQRDTGAAFLKRPWKAEASHDPASVCCQKTTAITQHLFTS